MSLILLLLFFTFLSFYTCFFFVTFPPGYFTPFFSTFEDVYFFCPILIFCYLFLYFFTIVGNFANVGMAFCVRLSKMPTLYYHWQHLALCSAYSVLINGNLQRKKKKSILPLCHSSSFFFSLDLKKIMKHFFRWLKNKWNCCFEILKLVTGQLRTFFLCKLKNPLKVNRNKLQFKSYSSEVK